MTRKKITLFRRLLRQWRLRGLLVLVTVACVSCAATGRSAEDDVYQRGEASYYADKFEGRPTASGEPYDPTARTAAHRRLPFGTRVRVTRTDVPEAPSVVVTINDRGPFARGRIIDLSKEGARSLNMTDDGVAAVRLDIVERPDSADADAFLPGAEGW
ncbi:MAG: septal ring lytic transglycosylase RlpA family protein [Salinibacter sp.]